MNPFDEKAFAKVVSKFVDMAVNKAVEKLDEQYADKLREAINFLDFDTSTIKSELEDSREKYQQLTADFVELSEKYDELKNSAELVLETFNETKEQQETFNQSLRDNIKDITEDTTITEKLVEIEQYAEDTRVHVANHSVELNNHNKEFETVSERIVKIDKYVTTETEAIKADITVKQEEAVQEIVQAKTDMTDAVFEAAESFKTDVEATRNHVNERITKIDKFTETEVKSIQTKMTSNYIAVHEELLSSKEGFAENIETGMALLSETLDEKAKAISTRFGELFDGIKMEGKLYIQDELLRLNDHVNNKLNTLKGDKGDKGDAGQKGDSGFLSGVSKWETGCITKMYQAVSHENGIWLCMCEETAVAPSTETSDYQLILDGIKAVSIENTELTFEMTSGVKESLGKTTVAVKGAFCKDTEYNIYDIVSHNKSSWISTKINNKDHPPGNGAWLLLAGKGQKGEPGKQGIQGERGADSTYEDIEPIVNSILENKGDE